MSATALLCGLAQAATNPLFAPLYTADPAVLVAGGRVYLFTGRDEALPEGKDYVMHDWRLFSGCGMVAWRDEGVPTGPATSPGPRAGPKPNPSAACKP